MRGCGQHLRTGSPAQMRGPRPVTGTAHFPLRAPAVRRPCRRRPCDRPGRRLPAPDGARPPYAEAPVARQSTGPSSPDQRAGPGDSRACSVVGGNRIAKPAYKSAPFPGAKTGARLFAGHENLIGGCSCPTRPDAASPAPEARVLRPGTTPDRWRTGQFFSPAGVCRQPYREWKPSFGNQE